MKLKYIWLNIRCYVLRIHNPVDQGWLNWLPDNGIKECDWCGKVGKPL